MGSIKDVIFEGIICRLCSNAHSYVVFIFGQQGLRLNLLEKINNYLPVKVQENDPLPKTICYECLDKILAHHKLIERIQYAQNYFKNLKRGLPFANQEQRPTVSSRTASSNEGQVTATTLPPNQSRGQNEPPEQGRNEPVGALPSESANSSRTLSVDSNDPVAGPSQVRSVSHLNKTAPRRISNLIRNRNLKRRQPTSFRGLARNVRDVLGNPRRMRAARLKAAQQRRCDARRIQIVRKRLNRKPINENV